MPQYHFTPNCLAPTIFMCQLKFLCEMNRTRKLYFSLIWSMITKWREKRKTEKGRAVGTGMVNKTIIALSGGLFSFDCSWSKTRQLLKGNQDGGGRKVKSLIVTGFYHSFEQFENVRKLQTKQTVWCLSSQPLFRYMAESNGISLHVPMVIHIGRGLTYTHTYRHVKKNRAAHKSMETLAHSSEYKNHLN